MSAKFTLYEEVVKTTDELLGPAADRFITRQIHNHLHKDPEELNKRDLKQLIDWIALAMALLSNDEDLVGKYISNLRRLARRNGN
jgi:hypothetical protein